MVTKVNIGDYPYILQYRGGFSGVDTPSADMRPVVCKLQRMVVGGSTFFTVLNIHGVVGHNQIGKVLLNLRIIKNSLRDGSFDFTAQICAQQSLL